MLVKLVPGDHPINKIWSKLDHFVALRTIVYNYETVQLTMIVIKFALRFAPRSNLTKIFVLFRKLHRFFQQRKNIYNHEKVQLTTKGGEILLQFLKRIGSMGLFYKTYYDHNLRIFVRSQCLPLESRSSLVYCLWVKPGAYRTERFFTQVGSGLARKHQTRLERLARDKHSRILQKFVNYEKVLQYRPKGLYHKTLYVRY